MADQLTLAFDTSAAHCAAALLLGDTLLGSRVEEMQKGQAERLMPLLDELLAQAGKTWVDLDRIGVGIGPGNFTGIRISVSAARGLALSLGIPAIGVSALEAMASGPAQSGETLALIDARQGNVYTQSFAKGGAALGAPCLCPKDEVAQRSPRGTHSIVGHHSDDLAAQMGAVSVMCSAGNTVRAIAFIASRRATDGARPAPLYLRPADAAPPRDPAPVIL
ncbi:tRNA (adenosine(37)-N6)-threonylcarbamoyltransferase complex dimerization subunit type 1 TsaB [Litoreibacter janthinus]|uniref:tRNA threonylcarbamoyl adenosine modification protein YeaZ n=1 Tax=Litoreibacter janthinus TaxID=670154 RepID=A0A1I6GFW1_9RHOB|nr:tRNA (adenosine(37)-N6)-threonylcarbamoyltransferase complex dimerization subunit type 1 TsaB [Litoreibacter janthinus]SFR41011.1 tRNA threonylcarbamoyl adenosine modification protein YeaZ [Litoreibacter janthinus]